MAQFSSHTSMVQRSKGQNAVAAAAYNARALLKLSVVDKRTNIETVFRFDYSKKGGLAYSKIYAPEGSPEWVYDREKLWNKAEECEGRQDSQTARKIMVALPIELDNEQHIALLEEFALALVAKGMIVDSNIHNDSLNNPHAHLMLSTRELKENRYGELEFSAIKNREWGKREFVKEHRELWAALTNKHLAIHGFDERVSDKSYQDLGLDIIPSVHEGPARNIQNSELVELNRQIAAENATKIRSNPSIVIDILALRQTVFTTNQIAKELEARLTSGVDYTNITDVSEIESMQNELSLTFIQLYEHILSCKDIKLVTENDLKDRVLYTSLKRFELEARFINSVNEMNQINTHCLNLKPIALSHLSFSERMKVKAVNIITNVSSKIEEVTSLKIEVPKTNQSLSKEQSEAVLNILNGTNITLLEGIPGAGKTTAMRELVRQYKKNGRTVIGVAPSSSAALELAKATGIECKNAAMWRKVWTLESGKKFDLILRADYYKEDNNKNNHVSLGRSLTKNHVMIIDESSMLELANMDYLISKAKSVGAKVILVGDNNQLSAVGFAGAFSKASDICKSQKLQESRRQQNPLHRKATILLSQYKVREALDIFHSEGAIKLSESPLEANNLCARDFVSDYIKDAKQCGFDDLISRKSLVIGVFANKTKASINNQVRFQLKDAGILKGKEYSVCVGGVDGQKQMIDLMRGEQIVFARNSNHIGSNGVCNGELATILNIRKPNEDGLTLIDVLVHKANGKKEKVSLDIARMSKSKGFENSVLFEYGYAVTAHKLQGATVDNVSVVIEKNVGFEVFNVLATRHRQNVRFYSNREVLESSFFESVDQNAKSAKNRFNLEAKGDLIFKEGLIKLLSKRTNTSFAHDYTNMGLLTEDKMIKRYLDESQNTSEALRVITSWQDIEYRKTGIKPKMWDHQEAWSLFTSCRLRRANAAIPLEQEYERFKNRLIQLNMNYSTILKHASQNKSSLKEFDKDFDNEHESVASVVWQTKSTILHQQDPFKNLVQSMSKGLDRDIIHKNLINVNLYIEQTLTSIEEKNVSIVELENVRSDLQNAIINEKHFRNNLTPEYLSRIFQTSKAQKKDTIQDTEEYISRHNGAEVFDRYKKLVMEHGEEEAVNMVIRKPTILGELRGYGIGRVFAIGEGRRDAIELCKNIGESLNAFNKSAKLIKSYNKQIKDGNFDVHIANLKAEVEYLRSLLPSDIDREFLKQIATKLKTDDKEIDWSELQKSELFKAIDAGQYINKNLESFREQKIASRNPIEVIDIIKQEQEYLINLQGNLKFESYHNQELITSIEKAHAREKDNKDKGDKNGGSSKENIFNQIKKLIALHTDKMGVSNDNLTILCKKARDPYYLHKSLVNSYQNYAIVEIQKRLDGIESGKPARMDGQHFTCQVKFLDHVLKSQVHNEFLPRATIEQTYENLGKKIDSPLIEINEIGDGDIVKLGKNATKISVTKTSAVEMKDVEKSSEYDLHAGTDHIKKQSFHSEQRELQRDLQRERQKEKWDREAHELRDEVKFNAKKIAMEILGEPNNKLSNNHTLRFGRSGKLAVSISGEKRGSWYDFSNGKSGDMFDLLQDRRSYDFKRSAEYLRSFLGLSQESPLSLVYDYKKSDNVVHYAQEDAKEALALEAKQLLVDKLYARSKPILTNSVAHNYLEKFRKINTKLGVDVRTTGIYYHETSKEETLGQISESNIKNIKNEGSKENEENISIKAKNNYFPAIVAFARNENGKITGGQHILLDKTTGGKANVGLVKKSFGKIAGSFVEVGRVESSSYKNSSIDERNLSSRSKIDNRITIIAEGLETALSVKQALEASIENDHIQIKVLCSLGISNIRNYQPESHERIIIAADNDLYSDEYNNTMNNKRGAITEKTINNAKLELQQQGAFVEIVRPFKEGDFNDILKTEGAYGGQVSIARLFTPSIERHTAETVEQYFASYTNQYNNKDIGNINVDNAQAFKPNIPALDKQEVEDLAYINKYNMPHDKILTAYRTSLIKGKLELEQVRKTIGFTKQCYQDNKHLLDEAKQYGYQANEIELIKSLSYMNEQEISQFCSKIRDDHYISQYSDQNDHAKAVATTPNEVIDIITQNQNFVANIEKNLKYPEGQERLLKFIPIAKENLEDKISEKLKQVVLESLLVGTNSIESLLATLKTTKNSRATYEKLGGEIESHHINRNIESFQLQRQKVQSPNEVTDLMKQEQEYLSNLHGNLKFESYHNKELITSIELAHGFEKDNGDKGDNKYNRDNEDNKGISSKENIFNQINKLIALHTDKMGASNDDLTNLCKEARDPSSLHKLLVHSYQNYAIVEIQKRLDGIDSGKPARMDGQHFTCQVKFLDHVLKSQVHNEFLPRAVIEQTHAKLLDHSKQHEMSKGLDGPDM